MASLIEIVQLQKSAIEEKEGKVPNGVEWDSVREIFFL